MERELKRKLERLDRQIDEALRNRNYVRQMQLIRQRKDLLTVKETEVRMTLKDAMAEYSVEDRREMTVEVITAVAVADMLNSVTIDVEERFKRFGITSVPMVEELRNVSKKLADVVRTIENVGNDVFTENYMDVVDNAEIHLMSTLKNYVRNELHKLLPKSQTSVSSEKVSKDGNAEG